MAWYTFGGLTFTWEEVKARQNVRKHGVRFEEAATVFIDPLARLYDDPDHSSSGILLREGCSW